MCNSINILSLLLLFIPYIKSTMILKTYNFGTCNTQNRLRSESDIIQHADLKYYLPQPVCERIPFIIQKTVNPYEDRHILTPSKKFHSACFRCAACLIIANMINKTAQDISIGNRDPQEEVILLERFLNTLCKKEFGSLKNERKYIILTETEGSGIGLNRESLSRMRETCFKYIHNINVTLFYKKLLTKGFFVTDYICRGDGVFRECSNIELQIKPDPLKERTNASSFKIKCKIK